MKDENESLKEFYKHVAGKFKYRLRDAFLKKFIDRWCHFRYRGKEVSVIFHTFQQFGGPLESNNEFKLFLRKVHIDGSYCQDQMSFEYQFMTVDRRRAKTVEDFIFGLFPKMCPLKKKR
jgi:hypothetical protein